MAAPLLLVFEDDAGADARLTKGFDPARVEAGLRRLLPRKTP